MLPESQKIIYQKYLESGNRVCTDTRNIEQGCVFFCLKGANFNGNEFASEAIKTGALCVICDEEKYSNHPDIILVEDALLTLQQLANEHCKKIDTKILAVGGSNGKTTTKELCYTVLSDSLDIMATPGNLNNHIGVPLSILRLSGKEAVAIIEMGTNHPGEMKILCDIAPADLGIVTNIGKEHLEGFGSIDAIAREESEIYFSLQKNNGTAIVNADDIWLSNMAKRLQNTFTIGIENNAELKGKVINSMPYLSYSITYQGKTYTGESALGGAYNLYNILFAIASGILLNLDIESCIASVKKYQPKNNRSEWKEIGNKQVLFDAYNANPSSMQLALKEFAKLQGTKCVLLGDMMELGEFANEEHLEILNLCKQLNFDEIYFSGKHFFDVCNDSEKNVIVFENTPSLIAHIPKLEMLKSQWIMIKGSRGMKMETVVNNN